MNEPLQEREMVKCEACGEYHYKDECEVVVIRIIKGKDCKLRPLAQPTVVREVAREVIPDAPVVVSGAGSPRKNIIPPAIAAMMIGPDHPMHESRGSKEIRVA